MLLVMANSRQEHGGLAREVLEAQLSFGFPRLGLEVSETCEESGLPDASRLDIDTNEV